MNEVTTATFQHVAVTLNVMQTMAVGEMRVRAEAARDYGPDVSPTVSWTIYRGAEESRTAIGLILDGALLPQEPGTRLVSVIPEVALAAARDQCEAFIRDHGAETWCVATHGTLYLDLPPAPTPDVVRAGLDANLLALIEARGHGEHGGWSVLLGQVRCACGTVIA